MKWNTVLSGKVVMMGNKIMELLEKKGQVSMFNDIFPLILEEFDYELPKVELAQEYVEQLLCGCMAAGFEIVCVPVFRNDLVPGELSVVDMVYKKLR